MIRLPNFLHNPKYDNWEVCKSCGGKVSFLMPTWWEEILLGKMGTLCCGNCGKVEAV